jgi:hypothetical protein
MATSPPRPETRYTASPDGYVAYQVFGTGPPDVVFMTNWARRIWTRCGTSPRSVVRGLAVHIAARVMSAAENGGILVSATVKDLVIGSGIDFADRGPHRLGVPGDWQLFEVVTTP